MRRFTVMGFTEAELGFVLAALFAAIAAAALVERDELTVGADEKADSIAAAFKEYRDSTQKVHQTLWDSLGVLQDSLSHTKRSNLTPRCSEKGESDKPIADVVVLGRNRYRLGRETLNFDDLRERLAGYIARSDSLDCKYRVRARPSSGVGAIDHSHAVAQLREHFYVSDRPE